MCNKINTTPFTLCGHFKQINLSQTLSRKDIVFDIVITVISIQLKNVIQCALSKIPMFEGWYKILDVGRINVENLSINPWRCAPCNFVWLIHQNCRNPSFGLATKPKGLQGCGPRGSLGVKAKRSQGCGPRKSPGVTSNTPRSVRKCEGVWGSEPSHSQGNSHFGRWNPNGLSKL
jgi:hypothetical protein